jgi:hypothetical protein
MVPFDSSSWSMLALAPWGGENNSARLLLESVRCTGSNQGSGLVGK